MVPANIKRDYSDRVAGDKRRFALRIAFDKCKNPIHLVQELFRCELIVRGTGLPHSRMRFGNRGPWLSYDASPYGCKSRRLPPRRYLCGSQSKRCAPCSMSTIERHSCARIAFSLVKNAAPVRAAMANFWPSPMLVYAVSYDRLHWS